MGQTADSIEFFYLCAVNGWIKCLHKMVDIVAHCVVFTIFTEAAESRFYWFGNADN